MRVGDGARGLGWQSPEARAHYERERAEARRAAAESEQAARTAAVAADQMPRDPVPGEAIVFYSSDLGWVQAQILEVVHPYRARVVGEVLVRLADRRLNPNLMTGHWSDQPVRSGYGPLSGNWRYTVPEVSATSAGSV